MFDNLLKTVNEARWADGLRIRNRLDDITYEPMRTQEEFIMRLIRENAKTAYGHDHGFENIRNMDEFRSFVSLSTFDDYAAYIDRIVNGERNVLTTYQTEHISESHNHCKIPLSRWSLQSCYDYSFSSGFYIAAHHGFLTDGMTLNLIDNNIDRLASGITVGNILGRLLTKREFDNDQIYVIPIDIIKSAEQPEKLYLQALFALYQQDISLTLCDQYINMLDMLSYIEKHWPKLTDDIEKGNVYVPSSPKRACAIREIMESHHVGTELVTQLWPRMHCIMVYDVDSLSTSFEFLRTYCGNKVHFIFTGIGSPLGAFTTALNIDDPQTVLIPDSIFYEFKPKDSTNDNHLLTLNQVEIGKSYELIVSTLSGFYRYKTGIDVLVVGRYHDTPTVIVDK